MTAVAQGGPEGIGAAMHEALPAPKKQFTFRHGEVGHLAHLLIKATSWVRDRPKDDQHEVTGLVDAEYLVPDDQGTHRPETIRMEWIVDPVLQELHRILLRSEVELFVLRRGVGEYFLMSRRRKPA